MVPDAGDWLLEAGFTVSVAEAVLAEEAVIVAVVGDETVDVERVNVPVVCPAGIVTDAGTVAAGLLLARLTCAPLAGAAEASVTVPVAVCPLVTEDGAIDRPPRADRPPVRIDNGVLVVTPPELPVMVAVVGCVTGEVATANSAPICPAGINASPATVAAVLLDANDTGVPPAGAGPDSVTTPVTGPPPTCELGARVIDKALPFCVPA